MDKYDHKGEDKIKSMITKRQCSLCAQYHIVGEEPDVYECYSIYRGNNPRKEIEGSIEVWDMKLKKWVSRLVYILFSMGNLNYYFLLIIS